MSEKLTLEKRALAAAIELRQATMEVTELRRINQKRVSDCEYFLAGDAPCAVSDTSDWCETCAIGSDLPERYKAASKRRTKALQRLRYIAQQDLKEASRNAIRKIKTKDGHEQRD